jgi:hypothetical protein
MHCDGQPTYGEGLQVMSVWNLTAMGPSIEICTWGFFGHDFHLHEVFQALDNVREPCYDENPYVYDDKSYQQAPSTPV